MIAILNITNHLITTILIISYYELSMSIVPFISRRPGFRQLLRITLRRSLHWRRLIFLILVLLLPILSDFLHQPVHNSFVLYRISFLRLLARLAIELVFLHHLLLDLLDLVFFFHLDSFYVFALVNLLYVEYLFLLL